MCAPDAPDTSGQQAAALQQAALSAEQLDFAKQIYADTAPDRATAAASAVRAAEQQFQAGEAQTALAKDYADYNRNTFRPLEREIVDSARAYDTEDRRSQAAGQAVADVSQQFKTASGSLMRNNARMGINPSSGASASLMQTAALEEAKAKALGATTARRNVEQIGVARMADAANLGRNLPSSQSTAAQVALQQGNSSVANSQLPLAIAQSGAAGVNAGFNGAQRGLEGASNSFGSIAKLQAGDGGAATAQALGQVAGTALSYFAMSDKTEKSDITPTDPDAALDAVNGTPVKEWRYKASSEANDGGKEHVGPMAQTVKKTMGEKAAPGGRKIDLVTMNGITMAAIQSLNRKVDKLAAAKS